MRDQQAVQSCAELVRRGDPDRFLAAMALPEARPVLFPIYAFNVEVARAPWVASEMMIAEIRLQWWRDALAEIAGGGTVREHEVVRPLAAVLDAEGARLLDGLVAARRWDIYRDPFEGAEDFARYLDATAGTLAWVSARTLGLRDGEPAVRDVAWAAGLASWLVAVPDLQARGRVPLVDPRAEAVAALAREGLARLRRARPPRAARPALLACWRAGPLLRQAARAPDRVAIGGLGQSEFARRAGLLWRSWRV